MSDISLSLSRSISTEIRIEFRLPEHLLLTLIQASRPISTVYRLCIYSKLCFQENIFSMASCVA